MLHNKRILAIVPARSGSKGIADKNLQKLAGQSLIARAAACLAALPWLDSRIISTDSQLYATEAEAHGLAAPFLRPDSLSGDRVGAVETLNHAIAEVEGMRGERMDIVLCIEPTSPLRRPEDLQAAVELLIKEDADSVVTVSKLDTKAHPAKSLKIRDGLLGFYEQRGAAVKSRQSLEDLYFRNGVCYALQRDVLMEKQTIFGERTLPLLIDRPLANIDEPIDMEWAEFLIAKGYE